MLQRTFLLATLLLSVLLGLVFADCANDCSGHGTCTSSVCNCDEDWAGDDCSISDIEMTNGDLLVDQQVDTRQWKFYHVEVSDQGLTIQVNETDDAGEVDVYIKKGLYPSKTDFDDRDVSGRNSVTMEVAETTPGTYYIGIYGFRASTYSIALLGHPNCKYDCSGHGSCVDNVCHCFTGYAGAYCGVKEIELANGAQRSDSIDQGVWKDYMFRATGSVNELLVMVTITSDIVEGGVFLYGAFDRVPSGKNNDIVELSHRSVKVLRFYPTQVGWYYFALYGRDAAEFEIVAYASKVCPNYCSQRGFCNEQTETCGCEPGFNGDGCEYMDDALLPSTKTSGVVLPDFWMYYTIEVPAFLTTLHAKLETNAPRTGVDYCHLYIQNGGNNPTQSEFMEVQFFHTRGTNITQLTLDNLEPDTYTVGVYGNGPSACTFDFSYNIDDCDPACRGTCGESGECICSGNHVGDNCEFYVHKLKNNKAKTSALNETAYWYGSLTVQASLVNIVLKELDNSQEQYGKLELYVGRDAVPDHHDYFEAETSISTTHALMSLPGSSDKEETWYIGVYGSSRLEGVYDSAGFDLIVFETPF